MGCHGRGPRGLGCRSKHPPFNETQLWAVVLVHLVVLLHVSTAGGCVFDCRTGAVCGGVVQYVAGEISQPPSCATIEGFGHNGRIIDLANRGITAIAEHGLDCYLETSPPGGNPDFDPNATQGDWVLHHLCSALRLTLDCCYNLHTTMQSRWYCCGHSILPVA
jgi:hypothetical protein